MRRAAAVLFFAGFAFLAYKLHRFDPGTLLEQSPTGPVLRLVRVEAPPRYVSALSGSGPLSVSPAVASPGLPLRVVCRLHGDLAGAKRLALRWSERGGDDSRLELTPAGPGAFAGELVPGPRARGLRLNCLDPERPMVPGWAAAVHVAAPEAAARLPRFARAGVAAIVRTSPADALAGMPGAAGTLRFDRVSETAGLRYFWRSEDADQAGSEARAAELAAAATALREFLGGDLGASARLYVKSCRDCRVEPNATHGQATAEAVTVSVDERSVVKVAVHELTHHLGRDVSRCTQRPALCEGLAVLAAEAYMGGLGSLEEEALAALPQGRPTELLSMDHARFYAEPGPTYTLSGALVLHLVERHGVRSVSRALGGAPLEEVFGSSGPRLEEEWRAALSAAAR